MGAADIVPGVSGGTIALVMGIYRRLVASIRTGSLALGRLLKLDGAGFGRAFRQVDWALLIALGIGIVSAVLLLAPVLETQLEENPVELAGLFLGLILGSVVVAWNLLKVRDAPRMLILAGVATTVFLLLGLREGTSEDTVGQIDDPATWAFFVAGAIAICAMILPGISGSFLLVLLGMYGPVLAAVNDRDLATLAVFLLGAIIGLALFSQALHWALNTHYDTVMAVLIGLMVGSLRVLWPWPDGVDSTAVETPSDPVLLPIVLAVVAFAVVIVVHRISLRVEHRDVDDEVADLKAS
jgi:putative membrane protein